MWVQLSSYWNSNFSSFSVLLGKQPHSILRVMVSVLKNCKAVAAGPHTCSSKADDSSLLLYINRLTPNDPYSGRTAPLTSKRCILYIYSTNRGTVYFKHGINSPFFPLQNAVCFIILTYLVPVLFTFYIQGVLKLKKNNSGAKRLTKMSISLNVFIQTNFR